MDKELICRIDTVLVERLDVLARDLNCSRDRLLQVAVSRFVNEESDLIAAIKEGEADIAAGRVYTQSEVEAMFHVRREDIDAA